MDNTGILCKWITWGCHASGSHGDAMQVDHMGTPCKSITRGVAMQVDHMGMRCKCITKGFAMQVDGYMGCHASGSHRDTIIGGQKEMGPYL